MRKTSKTIYLAAVVIATFSCINKSEKQASPENKHTLSASKVTPPASANSSHEIVRKPQIPVLCYHRIAEGGKTAYSISPATFEAHIKALSDSGYHSILPDQLYDYLVYNKSLPSKPVMITFDDSRREHAEIAAPVMEKAGYRGTFFIMTITYNKKNYMTTDQINKLAKNGHCIGLHSWDHTMVTKYKNQEDWTKEVGDPKCKLEKIIGKSVTYWAYPNGVYNHSSAMEMSKYMKLSFSLADRRDTICPLQSIRRIIVPEMSGKALIKTMRNSFSGTK